MKIVKQTGWLRKRISVGKGEDIFSGTWCIPWFTVQFIVSKWWQKTVWKNERTKFKIGITPRFTLASNSWIYAGIGIEWLEVTLNFGIATAYYRDSFEKELDPVHEENQ